MRVLLGEIPTSGAVLRLIDLSLKLTLLLAVLLIAIGLMRVVFRVSAARRASLLLLGSSAVPVVVASALFDFGLVDRAVLWEIQAPVAIVQLPPPAPTVSAAMPVHAEAAEASSPAVPASPGRASEARAVGPLSAELPVQEAATGNTRSSSLIFAIWIGGMVLIATRLAIGTWLFDRRSQGLANPIRSGRLWQEMEEVAGSLGIRQLPLLLLARDRSPMPATWGAWRHRVLLPASAEGWSDERLRLVLYHELAHVRRRDCLAGRAMALLLAPAWFHPLAWALQRRATDLREHACDDLTALGSAIEVDHYARELVSLSRRHQCLSGGSLAMARPQRLTARIHALYNPSVGRSSTSLRFRVASAGLLAASVVPMMLVSACQTQARDHSLAPAIVEIEAASKRSANGEKEEQVVTARLLELRDYLDRAPRHRSPTGSSARRDPVWKLAREWGLARPEFTPDRALTIDAETDKMLRTNTHRTVHGSQPFRPGIKRAGLLFESALPDSTTGKLRRIEIGDATVRALAGNQLSVNFTATLDEDLGGQDARGQAVLKTRKVKVGPLTIENGGGLVLGVAGVDVYQEEPGFLSFNREGRKMPYRRLKVLSFELGNPRPEFGSKLSISPETVFREGDKKVVLQLIELTHVDGENDEFAAILAGQIGQPAAIPEATMAKLPNYKGADLIKSTAIPNDRRHAIKFTREYIYPIDPEANPEGRHLDRREVGFMGDALVKQRRDGKLSVDLDFQMVEFSGFEKGSAGNDRPLFATSKIDTPPLIIENGGGVSLGIIREDVQSTEDKVPILGDIPLVGRLFRSKVDNHFKRILVVRVIVEE